MTEPEASLLFALYHIKNNLTDEDIKVCIDGAHVKTKDRVNFQIEDFFDCQGMKKIEGRAGKWKGTYSVEGYKPRIVLDSTPGQGDIIIRRKDGILVYAEAKKGNPNKSSDEYRLMREAIGQLVTGIELTEDVSPMVVVPKSEKSTELAHRWVGLPQFAFLRIVFALVCENGNVEFISPP